jgi:hypothetical protein
MLHHGVCASLVHDTQYACNRDHGPPPGPNRTWMFALAASIASDPAAGAPPYTL